VLNRLLPAGYRASPLAFGFFGWWFLVSVSVFTLTIWLQNVPLVLFVMFESGAPILTKITILGNLYLGIFTNFTTTAAVATVLIALLSGLNAGLLALYIKRTKSLRSLPSDTSLVQLGAMVSAVFGIGCASCGSIILMTILLQFGAGSMLFLMPWRGEEFAFVAVGLLSYSVFLLYKKLHAPLVCE